MANCKFCEGPTVLHPEICQRCWVAVHAVQDTEPKVLEKIIWDVQKRGNNLAKFAFLMRDWKEQLDAEQLNIILDEINESVRCVDAETGADYYLLVVHTPDIKFSPEEWNEIWNSTRVNNIPNIADNRLNYYEATQQEVTAWLEEVRKEVSEEEEAEEQENIEKAGGYMGLAEVAEYLGESKSTICNWRKRKTQGLPEPLAELALGPVWNKADIVAFALNKVKK